MNCGPGSAGKPEPIHTRHQARLRDHRPAQVLIDPLDVIHRLSMEVEQRRCGPGFPIWRQGYRQELVKWHRTYTHRIRLSLYLQQIRLVGDPFGICQDDLKNVMGPAAEGRQKYMMALACLPGY